MWRVSTNTASGNRVTRCPRKQGALEEAQSACSHVDQSAEVYDRAGTESNTLRERSHHDERR